MIESELESEKEEYPINSISEDIVTSNNFGFHLYEDLSPLLEPIVEESKKEKVPIAIDDNIEI